MKLLVLGARDVHSLLPYGECAAAMRDALAALCQRPGAPAAADDHQAACRGRDDGADARLPRRWGEDAAAAYGLKAICIFPGNPAAGLDSHQGVVLLSSAQTGEPLALLNASAVTEIRTAAVSAVATELLARADAAELAIIGTGVQARSHLLAIAVVRPLTGSGLLAGTRTRRAGSPRTCASAPPCPVTACGSAAEAVAGAGIVVTATSSAEPVLRKDWLAPGAHINAVGACVPQARELDAETMAAAAVFADSRESVANEAGDYVLARRRARSGPTTSGPSWASCSPAPRRAGPADAEITVFESLGLAIEDLAAATLAYRNATEQGAGTWVDF